MRLPLRIFPALAHFAATACLVCLVLTAGGVGLVAPVAGATPALSERWAELRSNDLRVATVMYRLTIANRRFCRDVLAPQPGFALHSLEQYGPADRAEAARSFRLGSHVGVMAVVANSPAARAGLRADDQLISVNGRELTPYDTESAVPTNAAVETAHRSLSAEMEKGEVTLLVTRADGDHSVRFTAEQGCPSSIELEPDNVVNASADGLRVMISAGLLERCATDDELAFVIAHELAHNLLHHAARLAREGISHNGLLPASQPGTAAMRETEEEADHLGVSLSIAAAYDLRGAVSFLNGLQMGDSWARSSSTHPAPERRLALLAAAIAERRGSPISVTPAAGHVH